jgi:hypothetical protein
MKFRVEALVWRLAYLMEVFKIQGAYVFEP